MRNAMRQNKNDVFDLTDSYWPHVVLGIAFYSMLCFILVAYFFFGGYSGTGDWTSLDFLVSAIVTILVGGGCYFIMAGTPGIIAAWAVHYLLSTDRIVAWGLVVGALVGGASVLIQFSLLVCIFSNFGVLEIRIDLLLSLAAMTVAAQFGGARGAWRVLAKHWRQPEVLKARSLPSLRFRIRHLLLTTTVVSVALTLLKALGLLTNLTLQIFVLWFVLQSIAFFVLTLISRRIQQRIAAGSST